MLKKTKEYYQELWSLKSEKTIKKQVWVNTFECGSKCSTKINKLSVVDEGKLTAPIFIKKDLYLGEKDKSSCIYGISGDNENVTSAKDKISRGVWVGNEVQSTYCTNPLLRLNSYNKIKKKDDVFALINQDDQGQPYTGNYDSTRKSAAQGLLDERFK